MSCGKELKEEKSSFHSLLLLGLWGVLRFKIFNREKENIVKNCMLLFGLG